MNSRIFGKSRTSGWTNRICLLPLVLFAWNTVRAVSAESPAPVATFRIHADGVIKEPGGHNFVLKMAPDKSLIVLIAQSHGRWTIKRLTEWQTQAPKEQSSTFSDAIPDRERNSFVWFDDPLIDPEGKYVIVHRHTDLENPPSMGVPDGTALVAVLELQTLKLVHKAQALDLRGTYLFAPQGMLLRVSWRNDGHFLHEVAALAVPELEFIASCDYNDKSVSPVSTAYLEGESSGCPAFLRFAHLSSWEDLSSLKRLDSSPAPTLQSQDVPGKDRYCAQLSGTDQQALFRCGNVHFDLGDGVFIVFWKALAVLSIPEGKVLLSLPLHWSDSESSGLFARVNGTGYLIVRHGFELQTYRLP